MTGKGPGPDVIRSIAVTADDVVTAVEARHQRDVAVVLRVTPPFSGRMRARLHVRSGAGTDRSGREPDRPGRTDDDVANDPTPVTVDPTTLLAEDAPPYPRPADTEDELRADPDADYSVERHHDRHRTAVAAWRRAVRDYVVDTTTIETSGGERTVDVVVLG